MISVICNAPDIYSNRPLCGILYIVELIFPSLFFRNLRRIKFDLSCAYVDNIKIVEHNK